MTGDSQLWLYHPKPLPDELLSSWLVRIAHGHNMKLQTFSRVSLGRGQYLWVRDIDRQAPDWLVESISIHTRVCVHEVRRTSLLDYQGVLYRDYRWSGPQYWLLPLKMVDTSFRHHGLQFCPKCLAEDKEPYFRKRWRVALYTMCTKHQCMVHDRCPSCAAPVSFHRREMGKFSKVDAGSMALCHACEFDLRESLVIAPVIFDETALQAWLPALRKIEGYDGIDTRYDLGFFLVLHQLCKILLKHASHVHLRKYVSEKIGAPAIQLQVKHRTFEQYSLEDRHVVIQLAMWLMVNPEERIVEAWRNKVVRYNVLKKDIQHSPQWYRDVLEQCANWRGSINI